MIFIPLSLLIFNNLIESNEYKVRKTDNIHIRTTDQVRKLIMEISIKIKINGIRFRTCQNHVNRKTYFLFFYLVEYVMTILNMFTKL